MASNTFEEHNLLKSPNFNFRSASQVAANGPIKLAQVIDYYGYCFDTGIDVTCYWYPATDVIVTDPWAPYPY